MLDPETAEHYIESVISLRIRMRRKINKNTQELELEEKYTRKI